MNDDFEMEELAPWLVLIATLIGGFLRALLLDAKGMWLDETFSVWMASHKLADLLQWAASTDQQPPLYYLLLHYWMALIGNTPYDTRLLSALIGTGTIPIIYLIGKRISGAVLGLAAAVILAFSPFHIYYAQETRMDTLLAFNAAVAMYALVRLLTDPRAARPIGSQFREVFHAWRTPEPVEPEREDDLHGPKPARAQNNPRARGFRPRRLPIQSIETDLAWTAWIVFSAATLFSHNTGVLFLLAANLLVFGLMLFQRLKKTGGGLAFQSPSPGNWLKAQVGILMVWSPWILPFIQQAGRVYQRFWIPQPTLEDVIQALKSFLNASGPIPSNLATAIWILYALVAGLGLVYFRKKISQFFFLVALFIIPLLGELIISVWRPIFWDRTLIWTTIPLYLILAAGVAFLKFRFPVFMALGFLATINLFSIGDYYRFEPREDWRTAARVVAGFAEENDLILFNTNLAVIPFDYYFLPYETHYYLQVEKRGLPQDLFESGVLEPEMTPGDIPALLSSLEGHNRVWLVYSHAPYTDPMGLVPQALASQMKLIRKDNFYGGQVQLYTNP